MDDLDRYHAKQMKNPEYAAEYERLQPEYDIIDALITARAEENLTQRELAERCGMRQSAFARIESGNANPTLKTLKQLADGMGKKLRISFV
ncbi:MULTISPECIES: helix-turn-helix domain-containing protein [Gordonibacter]|uniref:Helix-turn-helix transcriptional regulator n=1 Tax=Gordonibacter faecis TaxID=3047475 RepID=A0ABT7DN67_9ACTN|nr:MULTISPECIES: helix-turn-helix transcriptional regulator [unclassified Gordonibacter]MDJ1650976.1 helix-turn-helix transcriptional regulator [Gordonibacter sp. KGMB12511]HIW76939.1 helix-turn-helix transcriptional regulator [Candidatus Gordonibacter avicola]